MGMQLFEQVVTLVLGHADNMFCDARVDVQDFPAGIRMM